MKLLAVTDNLIFVKGLRAVLEGSLEAGGFEVEQAPQTPGALAVAVAQFRPELLLLDETRADVSAVTEAHQSFPALRIIAWIGPDAAELSLQLLQAGASALLQSNSTEKELKDCLSALGRGEVFVPPALGNTMWMSRRCKITPRESQLMLHVAQGLANKEIAFQLGISEGTVKVYLSRLFAKLGVSDRYELALVSLRNGAGVAPSAGPAAGIRSIFLKRELAPLGRAAQSQWASV